MTTHWTDQTTTQNTSGSPQTGSGTIKVDYRCSPPSGGSLYCMARTSGSSDSYEIAAVYERKVIDRIDVDGLQYYWRWVPRVSGAVSTLETV